MNLFIRPYKSLRAGDGRCAFIGMKFHLPRQVGSQRLTGAQQQPHHATRNRNHDSHQAESQKTYRVIITRFLQPFVETVPCEYRPVQPAVDAVNDEEKL